MGPIELLTKEFENHKNAYIKSILSLADNIISEELHKTHKENLLPKMAEYSRAINILKLHDVK